MERTHRVSIGGMSEAAGLIDPPPRQLNPFEFVLYKHSLFSLFCRKSRATYGQTLRQRLFMFAFTTTMALGVAVDTDVWMSESSGPFKEFGVGIATVGMTIAVVLPLRLLVGCFYEPLGDWLNSKVPCRPEWLRVEELLLLLWLGRIVRFALFDPVAAEANSAVVGLAAVCGQYAAEVPMLLVQYACFNRCCCACCMPKKDDFMA